jgi:membrane fusion protein, multidrug efflux system
VTVMPLKKQVFNHELISNGKVTAQDYADLYFRISEVVAISGSKDTGSEK